MRNLGENIALCALTAALESTSRSWVAYMDLQWRRLLTARLHKAYFRDMVSAPDWSAPRTGQRPGLVSAPDWSAPRLGQRPGLVSVR